MSAPTRISELTHTAARQAACLDCPTVIEQTGTDIVGRWTWAPVRCPSCILKRDQALDDEEARRGLEDAEGLRIQERCRAAKALEDLTVPPDYRGATLESFQLHGEPADREIQAKVVRMGLRYVGTWPDVAQRTLVLRGFFGTGKGHWVWSVVKSIVGAHGSRARVVKCSDLVRRLRASWGQPEGGAESETDVLRFYRDLDLLVIDEVSSHAFYGQGIHQHLYDVLDHRGEWQRPTILTTNETDAGLEGILRPALMDRLQHRGGIIEFGTASYRALAR